MNVGFMFNAFLHVCLDEERVPLHTYLVLGLEGLIRETKFIREEIQRMYRAFKQVWVFY